MKQMDVENADGKKAKQVGPPPPPPPPLLPRSWAARKVTVKSVTNQEIAQFWNRRRMEEEDHLLAAIKAAARLRDRNFTEDDYRCFEESLKDEENDADDKSKDIANNKELRVGIKDWWTKSKYAYLNQPAVESVDNQKKKRSSTYIPNLFLYNYKPPPQKHGSLGVF